MKRHSYKAIKKAAQLILEELNEATMKFPDWPDDFFIGMSIVAEELGEAHQAVNDFRFKKGTVTPIRKELAQTAAMCVRLMAYIIDNSMDFDDVEALEFKEPLMFKMLKNYCENGD